LKDSAHTQRMTPTQEANKQQKTMKEICHSPVGLACVVSYWRISSD